MGRGYTLKCSKCEFERNFNIGSGQDQAQIVEEAKMKIEKGTLGKEVKEYSEKHPDAVIVAVQTIYRCNRCGDLEVRPRLQIKDKNSSYTIRNFCEKCSARMGPVSDVQKVHCPTCKVPLEITNISTWD